MVCKDNRDINDALLRSVQWLACVVVALYMLGAKEFSIVLLVSLVYVILCVMWDIKKQMKINFEKKEKIVVPLKKSRINN